MHTAVQYGAAGTSKYRNSNRLSVRSAISQSIKSTGRVVAATATASPCASTLTRMASVSASTSAGGAGPGDGGSMYRYTSPCHTGGHGSSYCRSNSTHRSRAPSLAIIRALQQQQQSQQGQIPPLNMAPVSRKISAISQVSINGITPSIDDQASAMSDQLSINLSILLDGKIDWRVKLYRLQLSLLKYTFVFINSVFIATSVYLLFISNNSHSNLWKPDNSLIILALMFGIILSGIAISGGFKEELYLTFTYSIIFTLLLAICYAYYKQLTSQTMIVVFAIWLIICYYYCYILYLKPSPAILPDGTLITPKEQIVLNSIKRKSTRRQSSFTSAMSGKKTSNATSTSAMAAILNGPCGDTTDVKVPLTPIASTSGASSKLQTKSSASESDIPRRTCNLRTASVNFADTFWPSPGDEDEINLPQSASPAINLPSIRCERSKSIKQTDLSPLPVIQSSSVHSVV